MSERLTVKLTAKAFKKLYTNRSEVKAATGAMSIRSALTELNLQGGDEGIAARKQHKKLNDVWNNRHGGVGTFHKNHNAEPCFLIR